MNTPRRTLLRTLAWSIGLAAVSMAAAPAAFAGVDDADGLRAGMVFTSSNAAEGNEVLVYGTDAAGQLALKGHVPTAGLGSGAGLGSQGAVTLSGDGHFLFVVNAGSNTVTTFLVTPRALLRVSTVDSGGLHPISVTEYRGTVYVLNDGGSGNVAGFRNARGVLQPIPGASGALSAAGGTGPAQVGFSDDGDALVVTEKATNQLVSYAVRPDGSIGAPVVTPSPGQTPFGFAFNRRNRLVVTEAVGGAAGASTVSSYRFTQRAPEQPVVVSPAVPDQQGAACWVAVTPDGQYAFVANTGSSSISSYRIDRGGSIALLAAQAGDTGAGSAPADTAVSVNGQRLFVRNGRTATIGAFAIGDGGSLSPLPFAANLPATAVGLASN